MVYFIRDETTRRIKIGFTAGTGDERLKDLQTGSSSLLFLMAEMEGSMADEKALQARFAAHRLHGEWFTPAPELLLYISEVINARLEAENAALREALERVSEKITNTWAALGSLSVFLSGTPMGSMKSWERPTDPKDAEIERLQVKLEAEKASRQSLAVALRNLRESLGGK